MKKQILTLTPSLMLAFLQTACGGGEQAGGPGGGGFQMPPTPVEVATIERGELVDRFETVGSFAAVQSIAVASEISGVVREVPFEEGTAVPRGTLLARLDDAELAASLARAEATLEQTRNSYERVRAVVEQSAAAPQDLDDALAALRVAEAEAALARARLEKTRIRAAFDGYVGSRLVSRGTYLQPGQTVTELTQLDELEVVFNAPERYLPRLHVGAPVTVSTPAYPGVSVEGQITVLDPIVDATTRTVEVIARVPNSGLRFRPGMSADVDAILARKADALLVPSAAIFAEGAETLVYVVGPDSTVVRTPVVLGTRLAAVVEVQDGLAPGARVVRAGHQKLYPGAKVMPIPARPATGAPVTTPSARGPEAGAGGSVAEPGAADSTGAATNDVEGGTPNAASSEAGGSSR